MDDVPFGNLGLIASAQADWILSAIFVCVFARSRFHTPSEYVASTTVWRFRIAAWLYYAAMLMIFLLLAFVISNDNGMININAIFGTDLRDMSAPLVAALLLTTLMPNIPLLSALDEWLLTFFRDIGKIPSNVRRLRADLKNRNPIISEQIRDEVSKLVESDHRLDLIQQQNLRFKPDLSPQWAYTKVLVLFSRIERLESKEEWSRFIEVFQHHYASTGVAFEKLTDQAARCFALRGKNYLPTPPIPEPNDPIGECERHLMGKCDEVYGELCELAAYGVLRSGRSRSHRMVMLAELGFPDLREDERSIDPDQIVAVVFAIFIILLGSISLLGGSSNRPPHEVLLRSIMVAVIYGVAIFCTLLLKPGPGKAGSGAATMANSRPMRMYLLAGLVSAIASLVIVTLFKTLMFQDFPKAAGDLRLSWPWAFMSFSFAMALAWLCDDNIDKKEDAKWLRWVEAVIAAVVMALIAALVWYFLEEVAPDRAPKLPRLVVISGIIGLIAGFFIPSHYRKMRRALRVPEEEVAQQGRAPTATQHAPDPAALQPSPTPSAMQSSAPLPTIQKPVA
jgi:hypothetical protein